MLLKDIIESANTGLDAIQRAPIVLEDTGLKCLRIQDISQSKDFDRWGNTIVSEENRKAFSLKKDDIIIARTGSTIGVNFFVCDDLKSVYNNGLIRLRIKTNKALPYFVYCYLQTNHYFNFIKSISGSSATQPNMRINDLLELQIPNKTLTEQQHIVDTIGSVDILIEKNEETIESARKIVNFIFLKETKKFDFIKISELDYFNIAKSGVSKFENEKIYLDTASVSDINIVDESYLVNYENRPSRANMQPYMNTIWFAKLKDSPKYILVKKQKRILNKFIFSTGFMGLTSEKHIIDYLYALILSKSFNTQKDLLSNGATMQGINNETFMNILVPNVNKDNARIIGEKLERYVNLICQLQEKNHTLKKLKQILLQKYFG